VSRKTQQNLCDEKRDREKQKSESEARILELEKYKVFATSQAEAKVVMAEQKLLAAEEKLAKERADRAAETKKLNNELAASVTARGELSLKLENVEAGRQWLISQ
jgi:hypothetical protein